MSVLTTPLARPGSPARPRGPPKLSAADLRRAQAETLRTPRFDCSLPARLLFWLVDVIYGRQRSLRKFVVLEIVARVPYQAWERAAYGALTRVHPRLRLAGRVFERVVETRAQQDNEQYHLLILEELAQRRGLARPVLRFRLLPWLMAVGYYQLSWLLYLCWPTASYRLNAAFEDHAVADLNIVRDPWLYRRPHRPSGLPVRCPGDPDGHCLLSKFPPGMSRPRGQWSRAG